MNMLTKFLTGFALFLPLSMFAMKQDKQKELEKLTDSLEWHKVDTNIPAPEVLPSPKINQPQFPMSNSADHSTLQQLLTPPADQEAPSIESQEYLKNPTSHTNNVAPGNSGQILPFYKNKKVQIATGLGVGGASLIALFTWLALKK